MLPELYEKYKHLEDLKVFWGGKSKKITNAREYLERFFRNGTSATYFKDRTIQCYPGRNRSFYDLFFIVKVRFANITEEEVAYHIINLFNDGTLSMIPCPDVRKVTFFTEKMHTYGYSVYDKKRREYVLYFKHKYDDELSFEEIEQLAEKYKQQIENK